MATYLYNWTRFDARWDDVNAYLAKKDLVADQTLVDTANTKDTLDRPVIRDLLDLAAPDDNLVVWRHDELFFTGYKGRADNTHEVSFAWPWSGVNALIEAGFTVHCVREGLCANDAAELRRQTREYYAFRGLIYSVCRIRGRNYFTHMDEQKVRFLWHVAWLSQHMRPCEIYAYLLSMRKRSDVPAAYKNNRKHIVYLLNAWAKLKPHVDHAMSGSEYTFPEYNHDPLFMAFIHRRRDITPVQTMDESQDWDALVTENMRRRGITLD